MTMDQDTRESDAIVSRTYRELASEATPEHLNEKVLRMAFDARHEGRKRTSPYHEWLKPAAWAATVGLSLAVVIEISQVSNFREDVAATPQASVESVRDQFRPHDDNILNQAQELARLTAGPNNEKSVFACDKAARETAESWFACIEKLRESGRTEEADRENQAFTLQHADFLPVK